MYFYVSDKEHNRYSFRSRGTLLLENMDSNYNGLITDLNQIQQNDNRLFVFGKKFTNEILNTLIDKNAKFILSYSKDISKCISLAFHNSEKKIFKTNISVDINKFKFSNKKNFSKILSNYFYKFYISKNYSFYILSSF